MKKRYIWIIVLGAAFCLMLVLAFRAGMRFASTETPAGGKPTASSGLVRSREKVSLYFSDPEENYLTAEIREISLPGERSERAGKILEALLEGPGEPLLPAIPQGTKLLAFYLEGDLAVVDFSSELRENHPRSSHTEMLTLYAVANTLILNIPEIRSVKILVNGQEEDSLAGHVMIRYPLTANMTIVR